MVIGREPVFSRRYGSEHVYLKRKFFSINSIFCRRIGQWHGKKKSSRHEVFLGGLPSKFYLCPVQSTAVIGQEPIFSRRYGREHVCLRRKCFSFNLIFLGGIERCHWKKRAHDRKYSSAVSHPSTNCAQSTLTAVIGREPVFSRRYGREHVCLKRICFSINSIFIRRIGQ